ncbi:MAG: HD domain-containing protein [Clostridia bacterium]|nr:HD domain-containing protein [Clostridia bacterium]
MTFYSCLILITELMMLAMTLHVLHYSGFTRTQKTWYLLTFVSIMLCAAAEYAVHCGLYSPEYAGILTVLTVVQFSIAPMLGVFFSGALGLHDQAKKASFIFSLNLIVEIAAAPFGLVFFFDEAGYHRGQFFIIYGAFYFISLVYLLVCMIAVGKRFRHRDFQTIAMVLVILVSGIIPMTFFQLNVTYIAIALSASLCYIYYNDLVQQDIKGDLVSNQEKMSRMQQKIISGLASLIENRDIETGEHVSRTSAYVKALAEDARKDGVYSDQLSDHFISLLSTLAPMHDIGKVVVSDLILKKPGRLTPEEFEQMKKHAAVGGDVVREVLDEITDEEYVSFAADIATYHHERWDGTGYPKRLKQEEIPLSARIMAIADVFDALISRRCYKEPMPFEEAFNVIKDEAGSHFDPNLVRVFLKYRGDFEVTPEN